jgi:hypothetical protein
MSQQKASAIGVVAGAPGNPGKSRHDGCFDGVLKKKGKVELFFPDFGTEAEETTEPMVHTLFVVDKNPIAGRVMAQQLSHRRIRGNGYFCPWESRSHSSHGWGGHDGIADPISRANEYFPNVLRI